jgi:DNA-binding protein HU-beta
MGDRIHRNELVQIVSERTGHDLATTGTVIDATLEAIYETLKHGESVSLRDFGTLYVRPERDTWVFKFSPSQRLRAVLGWSSTYRGKL